MIYIYKSKYISFVNTKNVYIMDGRYSDVWSGKSETYTLGRVQVELDYRFDSNNMQHSSFDSEPAYSKAQFWLDWRHSKVARV